MGSTVAEMKMLDADIVRARERPHKLVILVGPQGSGKTNLLLNISQTKNYPYINLNLELSGRLIDMPPEDRSLEVQRCLEDLMTNYREDVIVFDNTELLFSKDLEIDPLRLLQALSRSRTIVASWNGLCEDGGLTYAKRDHPEYRVYKKFEIQGLIHTIGS